MSMNQLKDCRHGTMLFNVNDVENDRPDQSDSLIKTIYDYGYKMYWHMPPLFNPANYFDNSQNIFGQIVSKNMICIHKSIKQEVDCLEVSTATCQ